MTLVKFNHPGFKANTSFFDQFFGDDFFRPAFQEKRFGGCAMPAVNVSEGPESFRIDVAAPGLDKADFKTSLEKDVLTIKVEKEASTEESQEKYLRREFNYTQFSRSFQLPKSVDQTQITAKYENGVLSVSLPKRKEEMEKAAREIEIG
jgi:HSP20 family protein